MAKDLTIVSRQYLDSVRGKYVPGGTFCKQMEPFAKPLPIFLVIWVEPYLEKSG
jgi:hypothetical protein